MVGDFCNYCGNKEKFDVSIGGKSYCSYFHSILDRSAYNLTIGTIITILAYLQFRYAPNILMTDTGPSYPIFFGVGISFLVFGMLGTIIVKPSFNEDQLREIGEMESMDRQLIFQIEEFSTEITVANKQRIFMTVITFLGPTIDVINWIRLDFFFPFFTIIGWILIPYWVRIMRSKIRIDHGFLIIQGGYKSEEIEMSRITTLINFQTRRNGLGKPSSVTSCTFLLENGEYKTFKLSRSLPVKEVIKFFENFDYYLNILGKN